jgi:hypothetical protein
MNVTERTAWSLFRVCLTAIIMVVIGQYLSDKTFNSRVLLYVIPICIAVYYFGREDGRKIPASDRKISDETERPDEKRE